MATTEFPEFFEHLPDDLLELLFLKVGPPTTYIIRSLNHAHSDLVDAQLHRLGRSWIWKYSHSVPIPNVAQKVRVNEQIDEWPELHDKLKRLHVEHMDLILGVPSLPTSLTHLTLSEIEDEIPYSPWLTHPSLQHLKLNNAYVDIVYIISDIILCLPSTLQTLYISTDGDQHGEFMDDVKSLTFPPHLASLVSVHLEYYGDVVYGYENITLPLNLRNLDLINIGVQTFDAFLEHLPGSLTRFTYENWGSMDLELALDFPTRLTALQFIEFKVHADVMRLVLQPNVGELILSCESFISILDRVPSTLKKLHLFTTNRVAGLECLDIDELYLGCHNGGDLYDEDIYTVLPSVNKLTLDGFAQDFICAQVLKLPPTIRYLEIKGVYEFDQHCDLVFPTHLSVLEEIYIQCPEHGFREFTFPPRLRKLTLTKMRASVVGLLDFRQLPTSIEHVKITFYSTHSSIALVIPHMLVALDQVHIHCIDDVQIFNAFLFPPYLKSLVLEGISVRARDIINSLPESLKCLQLNGVSIPSLILEGQDLQYREEFGLLKFTRRFNGMVYDYFHTNIPSLSSWEMDYHGELEMELHQKTREYYR